MLITGFSEMISLGLVFPFVSVLINPESIWNNAFLSSILRALNFSRDTNIMLPLTICFSLASIFANATRLCNLWFNLKISQLIGNDLNQEAFYRTLNQPYSVHKNRNSDIVIASLTNHINLTINSVEYILSLLSSALILFFLLFTLFSINPLLAGYSLIVLISAYLYLGSIFKNRLLKNGIKIATLNQKQINIIQESLGGIRDIIINNKSKYYTSLFSNIDLPLRKIGAQSSFIGGFPRYAMEAIAMTLIAFVSYLMIKSSGSAVNILPFLGVLALSAQKMLPALQQIFKSWTCLQSSHESVACLLDLVNQPIYNQSLISKVKTLNFSDKIEFQNVSFKYEDKSKLVLQNINFQIKKGEKVGIIGQTGSGKSTTIDLIMGLLEPSSGLIKIDGKSLKYKKNSSIIFSWQKNIAHVPQNIYISDSTFAENIAFGLSKDKIDFDKVKTAAEKANIRDFIESKPYNYNTFLGERGSKISGGQKQRIGIARALYQEKDILILDEATSALDLATESSIIKTIRNLPKEITVIIISHRMNTLKNCDQIFEIKKGSIKSKRY